MRQFTIPSLDMEAMAACRERIDNLTKPIYSLAQLETMAERLAGIYGISKPHDLHYGVMIFCGDHLVDGPQNSTHGQESLSTLSRFTNGQTATQGVAQKLQADLHIVDIALEMDTSHLDGITTNKIMKGSHFFGKEAAMSASQLDKAMDIGFSWANRMHEDGVQAVAIGNIGEHTFLNSLVMTAMITGQTYESLLEEEEGKPSIEERAAHIHSFIDSLDVSKDDMMKLLMTVGGPDIAALTAFVLGAASHHMAIVFDNIVTGAAVLGASVFAPNVKSFVFPSESYDSPIHKAQLAYLQMNAPLHYGLTIDEALGSTMGLSILDASMHMLNDMKTFVEAKVAAAEDGPGNERQENPDDYKR